MWVPLTTGSMQYGKPYEDRKTCSWMLLMLPHHSSDPFALCPHFFCSLRALLSAFDFSPLKWPDRKKAPSGDWLLALHRELESELESVVCQQLLLLVCSSESTVLTVINKCNCRHVQDVPTRSGDCSAKVMVHSISEKQRLLNKWKYITRSRICRSYRQLARL